MALIYDDPYAEGEAERRRREREGRLAPSAGLRVQPESASNVSLTGSQLGPRGSYFNPVQGFNKKAQPHWGVETARGGTDIFAPEGSAVFAMRGGTVIDASYGDVGGYNVTVRGDDGMLYYYAHMGPDLKVKSGDKVGAGSRIGSVSDTGNAKGTGAHLHLGVGKDIKNGTGPQGGIGTDFDLIGALSGAEDETALQRTEAKSADGLPSETQPGGVAEYDQYTSGFGLPTGTTPAEIAAQARREEERQALAAAKRRRAMQQDWISQNVEQPYRSPIADLDWFGRGKA